MSADVQVVVLAGGVGGSRFLLGMREALRRRGVLSTEEHLTVVVNTGDDLWLSGVRVQPDHDSIMYALADANDTERGWGRRGETERVAEELEAWGAGWPWFTLGDLDLGTHIARTGWLRDGLTVSEVFDRLRRRWQLGARLIPMTDSEVDTIVTVEQPDGMHRMHFQEWWVRHRAGLAPSGFENPGIERARPAAGVVQKIREADVVVLAPSNPVVSLGPILAVPGIREALHATSAAVIGISPIIGGRVVRGMADACLAAIGVPTRTEAVAAIYGARKHGGLLDAWLLAEEDHEVASEVERLGLSAVVRPLWMTDVATSAAIAEAVLLTAHDRSHPHQRPAVGVMPATSVTAITPDAQRRPARRGS